MPHLVAYSEMHRDVRALGKAVDQPGIEFDPDMLAATLLVHRCFIAGAVRVGLWPVRVAAWWEYTWARVGKQLEVGPVRADPVWDRLMESPLAPAFTSASTLLGVAALGYRGQLIEIDLTASS